MVWRNGSYGLSSDDLVAVWFSCGAASAVAAKIAIDTLKPVCEVKVLNNPVAEEHPDNIRFLHDISDWLGVEIESVTSNVYKTNSAYDVWEHRKIMSFNHYAPCTEQLKKRPRENWEADNLPSANVFGFTFDEIHRHKRILESEIMPVLPLLIDNYMTKKNCHDYLIKQGIKLPEIYSLGFPNANCIGCVKSSSPTYWNLVRKHFPDVFLDRQIQSERLGVKLVKFKGKRIYLSELDPNTKGKSIKKENTECSFFCNPNE